jgi:hypothetical protein
MRNKPGPRRVGQMMARKEPQPEIIDPWVENLAWLMDESIPLGGWRIGLDGVLGLIPGIGDVTTGAVGALIIARASMSGIPRATVFRMIANVAIDSLVGSIPVVGDLFDFTFKANTKNVRLYRAALQGGRRVEKDWLFLVVVLLIMAALILLPILVLVWMVQAVL